MINRLLYIVLFFFSAFSGFSQAITVDTTSYSIPELVSKVLVNSPCIQTSNINWRTGSNFGSSTGIGYFESSNPNFPIKKGVILSTGSIKDAPGPNTSVQNGGNASWPGDADLENTMLNAGIPMISTNATVLEFNFIPISSTFSFDFLFASEEYGNSQCNFSDAFAYLLTDTSTGITTNLAVIPSTNTPISVFTVRDYAFNSTCSSSNSQYFDNYYGGALAPLAPTNFNGNTVKMTASAVLTPNVTYRIKLVIADRLNSGLDSAVFLSSQSFNLSQDVLGPDMTIANGTAICAGATSFLDTGLSPLIYTFSWSKNGVTIPGQTNPTLSGITAGTYTVTYTNVVNICEPITDTIIIENFPTIRAGTPNNIYKCKTGLSNYEYNLEINNSVLLTGSGSPTIPFEISYHNSLLDAEEGINQLPLLYNSPENITIYARFKNLITQCYIIKSFKLLTTVRPTANQPDDILQCSLLPTTNFNLGSTKTQILMGQSPTINTITYYKSQNEADAGVGFLNQNTFASAGQTIYTRIQNRDDADCFNTTNFNLLVNVIPKLDTINPKFICKPFILKTLTNGNYYDQPLGQGNQYFPGDIINSSSINPLNNVKTLYIFDPNILCKPAPQNTVVITFVDLPKITPKSGTYCSNIGFKLPALPYGKYYTEPGGENGIGVEIPFGTLIDTPQTIYTYFESTSDSTCITFSSFDVSIIDTPVLPPSDNVYDCSSYTLPPLTAGNYYDQPNGLGNVIPSGTQITSTQEIYVYTDTVTPPNCVATKSFTVYIGSFPYPTDSINCVSYTLPILPVGNYYTGPGGTGAIIPGGTIITTSTTLYVFVPSGINSNCPSLDLPFTITINLPPLTNPNDTSISYCGSYKLLPLTNGNYYTSYSGRGTLLNAGYEVKSTQTIYIYISIGSCKNEIPFTIKINKLPIVDNRADLEFCGGTTYILTPMSTGSQGNYYTGPGGTVALLKAGDAITTTQTIYVYATTNSSPPCPVENYFTINFTPRADVLNPGLVCEKYVLPVLSNGNYYTGPNGTGTQLNAGDEIFLSQKIYIYSIINNRNGPCTDESSFFVTVAKPILFTQPTPRILCDEDGINDGIATIVTTKLTDDIIVSLPLPPSEYVVNYYDTLTDASLDINKITSLSSQNVYFKIYNIVSPTCFSRIGQVNVVVSKIPNPTPTGGFICTDTNIPFLIQSGLSGSNLSFEWFNNNASILMLENSINLSVNTPDIYGVRVKDNSTNCSSKIISAEVLPSSAPTNINFNITNAFINNQITTVIASGISQNFEYKLDSGPYQDNPTFENITAGEHTITVRDKNGCGLMDKKLSIINYPKYFTPNFDGVNDTWNVDGLQDLSNCFIYIYDRYGKFLKQINSSGPGWDGYYNGTELPSSDYWFTVSYVQDGVQKEFKSHFSLKR